MAYCIRCKKVASDTSEACPWCQGPLLQHARRSSASDDAPLASRWARFCAVLIDAAIGLAIVIPIMAATGAWQRVVTGQPLGIEERLVFGMVGWAIFLMAQGYPLSRRGQTIGKLVMKIQIVDM